MPVLSDRVWKLPHATSLARTACHEAGHIAVAAAIGGDVLSVEVGDREGATRWRIPGELGSVTFYRNRAIVALAGQQAQAHAQLDGVGRGDDDDWDQALESCKQIHPLDYSEHHRACRAEARRLVAEHWPTIERLTETLVRYPRITDRALLAEAIAAARRGGDRWQPKPTRPASRSWPSPRRQGVPGPRPWRELLAESLGRPPREPAAPRSEVRVVSGTDALIASLASGYSFGVPSLIGDLAVLKARAKWLRGAER